jgi:hypothetical protein
MARTSLEQLKREALAGLDATLANMPPLLDDMVDQQYVEDVLAAARAANVRTASEWHRLTLPDCAAGYHREVEAAELAYFEGRTP